jgi:hypothetical protein
MTLQPITSSSISAIGYDADEELLRVEFNSGHTYDYKGVTADEHKALLAADSVGGYFAKHIRAKYHNPTKGRV